MKGTRHNGRSGKNGVYNPLHNDRRFNPEHSEHIDNERVRQNIYWDCYQGYTTMADRGKEDNFSFNQIEMAYYVDHYSDYVINQNKRHEKARHPDRCKGVEDVLKNKKTCPEESIYQLGTIDEHASVETLVLVFDEFKKEFDERFGSNVHIIDWSLHMDEATPHIHERHVFDATNRYSLSKRLTNRIRQEPHKYRWIPKKVHFDYIGDASDALYPISFRVVRFAVKEGLYETVITNLPADRFPPPLLRELYHKRWGIETSFRDLKYTLALTHFHAKKRPFIKQEIFSRMTLYNFASLLRLHAVFTQPEGKHLYRINTAFAAHIAREFLLGFVPAVNVEPLITKFLLPVRPGLQKPRNMRAKRPISFQYRMI